MQHIKLAEFMALKQKAASEAAETATNEVADLLSKQEFPELESSGRGDLSPTAKQIWQYVDENPYFESLEDSCCFKAVFCTHETAPQAAKDMAQLAFMCRQWQEPTC